MKNLELRIKRAGFGAVGCNSEFSVLNSQFLILGVICTVMTCSIAVAAEGLLQFRFQPGDKFSLESVIEQKTVRSPAAVMSGAGQDAEADSNEAVTESTLRLRCDLDVEEVEQDGCVWAKYTYRQIALKARAGDSDVNYDSDATGRERRAGVPPEVLPVYFAFGEGFFVRITPQGLITNINGLSAVAGNAKSKVPGFSLKDRIIQGIDQQFDEAAIKHGLETQFAVFPDANSGPVSIGDTWSRKQQSNEEKISLERTFRLKGLRDGIAYVDVNVIVGFDANEAPISFEGLKASRGVSGRGTGRIEIEQASGRIINSALTQDVVQKIRFLPKGAMRRPPPAPAPTKTHIVTTFQMIRRDTDAVSPEPNQPVLDIIEGL